ncbi:aspartic peptidase domain-containing protein [Myxozyma melibiosi]|uniref:Aspartic peptidase domain-containing protein n=1 Tax=Myxozyma melibiosi TaxID=54550 RepID=A0ABR1F7H9_9ASCO
MRILSLLSTSALLISLTQLRPVSGADAGLVSVDLYAKKFESELNVRFLPAGGESRKLLDRSSDVSDEELEKRSDRQQGTVKKDSVTDVEKRSDRQQGTVKKADDLERRSDRQQGTVKKDSVTDIEKRSDRQQGTVKKDSVTDVEKRSDRQQGTVKKDSVTDVEKRSDRQQGTVKKVDDLEKRSDRQQGTVKKADDLERRSDRQQGTVKKDSVTDIEKRSDRQQGTVKKDSVTDVEKRSDRQQGTVKKDSVTDVEKRSDRQQGTVKKVDDLERRSDRQQGTVKKASIKYSENIDHNESQVSYYISIIFGTDSTEFTVVVDTGSYDLWVYGDACTNTSCTDHNQLGTADSSTLQINESDSFQISYGQGDVSGVSAVDYVSFAGYNLSLGFGSAEDVADSFDDFPIDGIFGLASQDTQINGYPSVVSELSSQGLISREVFAIDIGDDSSVGRLTFGGVDTSRFAGEIDFVDIIQTSGLWLVPLEDCVVDDEALGFTDKLALIDSGTTLMLLPSDDADTVHQALATPGGANVLTDGSSYVLLCNTTTTLEITIGSKNWTISPDQYLGGVYDDDDDWCLTNIQAQEVNGTTTWVLGSVFMQSVYVVFDRDAYRVGLAEKGSGGTDYYDDSSAASFASTTTAAYESSTSSSSSSATSVASTSHVSSTASSSSEVSSTASSSSVVSSTESSSSVVSSTASSSSVASSTESSSSEVSSSTITSSSSSISPSSTITSTTDASSSFTTSAHDSSSSALSSSHTTSVRSSTTRSSSFSDSSATAVSSSLSTLSSSSSLASTASASSSSSTSTRGSSASSSASSSSSPSSTAESAASSAGAVKLSTVAAACVSCILALSVF